MFVKRNGQSASTHTFNSWKRFAEYVTNFYCVPMLHVGTCMFILKNHGQSTGEQN